MRKNKSIFNFKIEDIIQANLSLQTVQRTLKSSFNLNHFDVQTVFNSKYINIYKSWDENKQKLFISTIGGKANFYKTKNFIEEKINKEK